MSRTFLLRLGMDALATCLLFVALAYYWLDNTVHEIVGTAMFLFVAVHNIINRRWYGRAAKARKEPHGVFNILVTVALLAAVATLLVTSLMISRSVFAVLGLNGGFSARQIHTLAAYWVMIAVAVHVGIRWSVIMNTARGLCGIQGKSTLRKVILRLAAVAIAVIGVRSSLALGIGDKLTMRMSMDFWDFNVSTAGFFLHLAAIFGLYVTLSHFGTQWLLSLKRRAFRDKTR